MSKGSGKRAAKAEQRPALVPRIKKPGMFASKDEKAYARGLQMYLDGAKDVALTHFKQASDADTKGRSVSDEFFVGMISIETGDTAGAIPYLEDVVASDVELPDLMMRKFGILGSVVIPITERVTAQVEWGSFAAALLLAECYQENNRSDEAIGLLQQLSEADASPALTLSLCELLAEQGAWDDVVEASAGVKNDDDTTLEIRLLQAQAFTKQGLTDATLEAYKDALRSTKRDPELLKEARYERAAILQQTGKAAQARKELEKLYADDPGYRDVAQLVRQPEY